MAPLVYFLQWGNTTLHCCDGTIRMRVQVGGYFFVKRWHFDIEVGCVWGRREAEWKWAETIPGGKSTPSIDPSALFNCFTLCPCGCEVMVIAIMMLALMIMRFMWNRKKVAITGVKRTIAIKTTLYISTPCGCSTPTVPCYNSRAFANWNSSQVVVLPPRKPITPPFPSFTTTPVPALLIGCDPKKFFSGGSSLWQVKVPPSLKDLWTPTN